MIADEPCMFIAAYRDPVKAQNNLEARAGREEPMRRLQPFLYRHVSSQADGESKQFPRKMMFSLL